MVKKVEGEETQETQETEETQETLEEKTPTAEEQLATAQAEKKVLEERATTAEKGLKTAHSKLTEKDKEIRKQADLNTRMDGFEETIKILAAMQDEKVGDIDPDKRTDYVKQFEAIQKKQRDEREQLSVKSQQDEYNAKADAIYARAKEAFKDDEDSLFQVRTFLMSNAGDLAEQKVAKAEKTTDTKGDKVESEEERISKLVDEKLRVEMESRNMLESETGGPSGGTVADEKWLNEVYPHLNDPASHERAKKILDKMK